MPTFASGLLADVLSTFTKSDLLDHIRARELPTTGVKATLVARLVADTEGDLNVLLREGGWGLRGWNQLLEDLDLSPRRSYAAVARELGLAFGYEEDVEPRSRAAAAPAPAVSDAEVAYRFDPARAALAPRPYQRELHTRVLRALESAKRLGEPGALLQLGTGGGKTFSANQIVTTWLDRNGGYALWVTKDWWLLRQAAQDRAARVPGAASALVRVGGTKSDLSVPQLPRRTPPPAGAVAYTTLQTLSARKRSRALPRERPSLVVWDECHWAQGTPTSRALQRWLASGTSAVPILGLTATPRRGGKLPVVYRKSFRDLVAEGHLARPLVEQVGTGVNWRPERTAGGHGDFRARDLDRLAKTLRRNKLILQHYANHRARYGKTLVFACDISHANRLARLARDHGIGAAAVHSGNTGAQNSAHIADFVAGRFDLLFNVSKMTHGVDIPAIQTVFLCRPTTSDILFTQMAGRGARVDPKGAAGPGAATYHLVEFTDNVARFQGVLQSASHLFEGAMARARGGPTPSKTADAARHGFDPAGHFRTLTAAATRHLPALEGLALRAGQTFGVELELTRSGTIPTPDTQAWTAPAESLNDALLRAAPEHTRAQPHAGYGLGAHGQWTTEYDGTAGWEVVSRVLSGEAGVVELGQVLRGISAAAASSGLRVNHRTGLHLHLGWRVVGETPEACAARLTRLLLWVHALEPWLGSLVAPSRLAEYRGGRYRVGTPNFYCQPVAAHYPVAAYGRSAPTLAELERHVVEDETRRYCTVNLQPFFDGLGTVEVRLHGGTTDPVKVAWWLALWTAVLWLAEHRDPPACGDDGRRSITPDFGAPTLAAASLPAQGREVLLMWSRIRQQEVAALWRRAPLRSRP